jgi:hypothetical protein
MLQPSHPLHSTSVPATGTGRTRTPSPALSALRRFHLFTQTAFQGFQLWFSFC